MRLLRGSRRRRRVFLGPTEIAGYYGALEDGFRKAGVDAVAVDLSGHRFLYGGRRRPLPVAARPAAAAYRQLAAGRATPLWRMAMRISSLVLFAWAVVRFDTFIFSFGRTFLGLRELPILRLMGKRMIFVLHGSDARPAYLDGGIMGTTSGHSVADCVAITARQKRDLVKIERHATAVVAHPLYAHLLERPYVRSLALGVPVTGVDDQPRERDDSSPVRVLHSPSHPEAKGSVTIRATVVKLKNEGFDIDYVELAGVAHADILAALEACDLVVDQLYSDTAMAGLATEAAWHGRPTVVGSYGWDALKRLVPAEELGPVRACHPDDLERAIAGLVADRVERQELGRRARQFVTDRCRPVDVAERFLRVIDGHAPDDWLSDPHTTDYRYGWGLPAERARANVRDVIRTGGVSALQLSDKPKLQAEIEEWAMLST
jgi:hypothetical protein